MAAPPWQSRMQKEIRILEADPPPGVCAWPVEGRLNHLEAEVAGPWGTVYEGGQFRLEVHIPDRYPFEPPKVRFLTPVYHPNIDSGGRICLDTLNMPPKGVWKPSLNIPTVLASIGLLLSEPNPDDGLMADITEEYKHNRGLFDAKAKQTTQQHAVPKKKPREELEHGTTTNQASEPAPSGPPSTSAEEGGASRRAELPGPGTSAGGREAGEAGDGYDDDPPLSDSSDDDEQGGQEGGGDDEVVEDSEDEALVLGTQAFLEQQAKRPRR